MSINTKMTGASQRFCPNNAENDTIECVGPVNLTAQFNTGSRPCCKGAGDKYTAMGNKLSFCSVNGGKEYLSSRRVLDHYPLFQGIEKLVKNNRINGRLPGYSAICEGYNNTIQLQPNGFGIY
jgi:hypothetical protein